VYAMMLRVFDDKVNAIQAPPESVSLGREYIVCTLLATSGELGARDSETSSSIFIADDNKIYFRDT